jgi:hypothetical protein
LEPNKFDTKHWCGLLKSGKEFFLVKNLATFVLFMKNKETTTTSTSSKGAPFFKKMLEDKKAIREHIQKGGKIADIKDKFNFVKPLSITSK